METSGRSDNHDGDVSSPPNFGKDEEHSSSLVISQPEENVQWVQCENPNCLKWRVLSQKETESLNVELPWFCHMSEDILHSSCDDPEEKYASTWKMKRHGLSYTYSLLPEGAIVWAKLVGYCKWPAVLCSSPYSSDYVILDNDGDPHSYHVEFLGTKHSIAWVHHDKVTAYGNLGKQEALETCSQPLSQVSMNRFRCKAKRRKKTNLASKKRISVQLSEQLQKAIDEADDMLELTKGEILSSCQYRFKPNHAEASDKPEEKMKIKLKPQKRKRKTKKSKPEKIESLLNSQLSNHAIDNKLSDFRSKEERLMADIKGLKEREKEFMNDYTLFMKKKKKCVKNPQWFGVSVDIFQLYMAVQDRGGFNEVCASSLWKEIVFECCDITTKKVSSSASSTAMTFYSRHLLPYEMHIKNAQLKDAEEDTGGKVLFNSTSDSRSTAFNIFTPSEPSNIEEDEAFEELKEIEALLQDVNDGNTEYNNEEAVIVNITEPPCQSSQRLSPLGSEKENAENLAPPSKLQSNEAGDKQEMQYGIPWHDLLPSQVVPEVIPAGEADDNVIKPTETDSDEDLFAEINRDDELLQSLLLA